MKNHGASRVMETAFTKTSALLLFAEHPVFYVKRVTDFIDSMIDEHGDYMFMVAVFVSIAFLLWFLTRRRKAPVRDFPVVILPMGQAPKREEDQEPPLFGNLDDEH